jgi:hypothetical protein
MRVTFDKAKWMLDGEGAWLMIQADRQSISQFCNEMKEGKKYQAELKEFRKKRSLDANAYFWTLCGSLAAKLNLPKEEVYRCLIKDVGDNNEVVPIKNEAVDKWIENWQQKGLGWVCEILGESKLEGYTNIITYYGSSTYDSAQMSRLISLVVEECKEQGIETMTPQELSLLLEGWR